MEDEHNAELAAIARLKNGDISALEFLVRKHQVIAIRTAYFITGDHALAEDVVQEVFLRLYRSIGQFDTTRPFKPWLLRSVANDAVKLVSRRKPTISLDTELSGENFLASLPTPDEIAEQSELETLVKDALNWLPAEQRAAVVMRYFLDLNDAEISEALNCPPGTVKWRLHTARKQLQVLLRFW